MPAGFATLLRPGTGALRRSGETSRPGSVAATRQSAAILNSVSGGLPTRRYDRKFEEVVKSAQEAAVLVLVY
jgi:hypothetical protein